LTIFLVLNYARFSFEEFIVVSYLANFRLFVRILVCFPHCIYLLFSLFNFQDAKTKRKRFVYEFNFDDFIIDLLRKPLNVVVATKP